jgi:hypothetical protein
VTGSKCLLAAVSVPQKVVFQMGTGKVGSPGADHAEVPHALALMIYPTALQYTRGTFHCVPTGICCSWVS